VPFVTHGAVVNRVGANTDGSPTRHRRRRGEAQEVGRQDREPPRVHM